MHRRGSAETRSHRTDCLRGQRPSSDQIVRLRHGIDGRFQGALKAAMGREAD